MAREGISAYTIVGTFWDGIACLGFDRHMSEYMPQSSPNFDDGEKEALAWDAGCQSDPIRNGFIAPFLIKTFNSIRPQRILDIGTGTAYLPRIVDPKLDYKPEWTVIDQNANRIGLASSLRSPHMILDTIIGDVDQVSLSDHKFDATLMTFTLLELRALEKLVIKIASSTTRDGLLIIALPDVWRDALDCGVESPAILKNLLSGSVDIPKIDKFTGASYPFHARRIEQVIVQILRAGFCLVDLVQGGPDKSVYILQFQCTIGQTNMCDRA